VADSVVLVLVRFAEVDLPPGVVFSQYARTSSLSVSPSPS